MWITLTEICSTCYIYWVGHFLVYRECVNNCVSVLFKYLEKFSVYHLIVIKKKRQLVACGVHSAVYTHTRISRIWSGIFYWIQLANATSIDHFKKRDICSSHQNRTCAQVWMTLFVKFHIYSKHFANLDSLWIRMNRCFYLPIFCFTKLQHEFCSYGIRLWLLICDENDCDSVTVKWRNVITIFFPLKIHSIVR